MKIKIIFSVLLFLSGQLIKAQQSSYFDAAQAYNRLLIEKNNGTYMRINNYKVIGTPYLFGEKNNGDLYAKGENAQNIIISYNSYNNEVAFYPIGNSANALIKDAEQVDSFVLKPNGSAGIVENAKFISSEALGAKDKTFYLLMYEGPDFNLYKKYKSSLGIVSTNYVQSELRQFDLTYEYYYMNNKTKQLKKLKPSNNAALKEFKDVKDISSFLNENNITANPDIVLKAIFASLNNK
jgi:hypothetical protein